MYIATCSYRSTTIYLRPHCHHHFRLTGGQKVHCTPQIRHENIHKTLLQQNYHQNLMLDFWFWRDAVGHEVDFIWQNSEKINLVEIKASQTIMHDMFKGLSYFEKFDPQSIESKTLVHTGLFNQNRTAGKVLSWRHVSFGKE